MEDKKVKTVLGLDLGTNSIGWALIDQEDQKILGMGSRIIPMSQEIIGDFEKGNKVSQTANRTSARGVRRLRERHLLRRERLHRVLNILGFLPKHFSESLDDYGQILQEQEPKIAYFKNTEGEHEFFYKDAFNEMIALFREQNPKHFEKNKNALIPYDWTIYYLRQKALSEKISKEEFAWLLLSFNQKRGYYQLRGEDEETNDNKLEQFYNFKIVDVEATEKGKSEGEVWYNVILENGWIYRRSSRIPLFDWIGKYRDFIVTTDINEDGTVKVDKDGKEKRSFRAPKEDDWGLLKKKTEQDIITSDQTVGQYIFNTLLDNPKQKIKGKLVRTIERKFYREELDKILTTQLSKNEDLKNNSFFVEAIEALYKNNEQYRNSIKSKDFKYLFLNDIIFYQRPLKSKKSLISNCELECKYFTSDSGKIETQPIKCISRSHPLFQEFRLWQWMQNLKIVKLEKEVNGRLLSDVDVSNDFLKSQDDYVSLFEFLNDRKDIDQKAILKHLFEKSGLKGKALSAEIEKYRWNFVDKPYPCNETRSNILNRLAKVIDVKEGFLTKELEIALWHILYSVKDKNEIIKALGKFAKKNDLDKETFVENFKRYPLIKSEFGAYSEKAIKKLLPLMRIGKYWDEKNIHTHTIDRINKIINSEYDAKIRTRVREKAINLEKIEQFQGLPLWLTSYIVYDKHSEAGDTQQWKSINQLDKYIQEFKQHSLRNPIVEQVLTETLRVVKDIWKHFGNARESFFDEIHIELGREMKNNAEDRKSISDANNKNEATNLRIRAMLEEFAKPEYNIENVRPYSPSQVEILKIYEDGVLNSSIEISDEIQKISKSLQPTNKEIMKYKLWLEQGYRSPYTGDIIPLSKLFTPYYEIEHIIPQSIYFDDSYSNKVICESEVNKLKGNQFGYEFILNHEGEIVDLGLGKTAKVFMLADYETFVKANYSKSYGKMKKLMLDEVPEKMVERQLNDTRYVSKIVKNILSNLVRSDSDDDDVTSKNVLSSNGSITSQLKHDWGLNDVWNGMIIPRFERMNQITNSNQFGYWDIKDGKKVFQIQMPIELQKGFNKKRIDHRHHALDALVIALAGRNHINYLNNQSALSKDKTQDEKLKDRRDLRAILCEKVKVDSRGNYKWQFIKPWSTFTQDTREALETIVISFKQNLRVINKTVNYYQKYVNGKKEYVKQIKGDNWAIRKSLHKDTVAGLVSLQMIKEVSLLNAIDSYESIKNKSLRAQIIHLKKEGLDKAKINKFFKDLNFTWEELNVARVKIYYYDSDIVASRTNLDDSFNAKKIASITDSGIQKILSTHLSRYDEIKDDKTVEHPELAFSAEGIEEMNKNIITLNNGKNHQPIYKVRTYETKGNKFQVGHKGNKKDKYVEAAKGTNLYFAIYIDDKEKRSYETIPFNVIAERLKQGLNPIPDKEGCSLLFSLSPNDLVYIPNEEEVENLGIYQKVFLNNIKIKDIYKIVSFTGSRLYAIPYNVSGLISDKVEFSQLNKVESTVNIGNVSIKLYCIKLSSDRLGNITVYKTTN